MKTPKKTVTESYRALIALLDQGVSVEQCAHCLHVSVRTVNRWKASVEFIELRRIEGTPEATITRICAELYAIGMDKSVPPYARTAALSRLSAILSEREVASDVEKRLGQLESAHDAG